MENNKLKILFLPARYPSEKEPVAGVFIREHAKAVSFYNEVVVIYNEGYDKKLKKSWQVLSDNKEDGIRTIRIKSKKVFIPIISYLLYLWSMTRAFKKILKEGWKPEVIHASVYSAGVPGAILSKLYKIPLVITEHCTNFATHSVTPTNIKKAKFAFSKAKVIMPVSNALKGVIEDYYGIKNRFHVVPNTVNTQIFFPPDSKTKNKESDKKKMLLVAVLTHRKGISFLLKSLFQLKKKRKDFLLDIVGNGASRKEYEELTEELGLKKIVEFHGLKSKEETANFMRDCDLFVLPSPYETFGVVYIESMACGKPVIATNAGGPKEFINEHIGILVPPEDVDALTKAVNYMLDHYQDYSVKEISQYAIDNFSYEIIGKKLSEIYQKVLNENER